MFRVRSEIRELARQLACWPDQWAASAGTLRRESDKLSVFSDRIFIDGIALDLNRAERAMIRRAVEAWTLKRIDRALCASGDADADRG